MLSTLAILAAGCLIDVAIVVLLAYMTDGRRGARKLYKAPPRWSFRQSASG